MSGRRDTGGAGDGSRQLDEQRGEVDRAGEPPVVARLMVEIRSDGSRTIARGAMEEASSGQRVAVEARGDTPLELAMSLAKTMARGPALARSAARALAPDRPRRGRAARLLHRLRRPGARR